VKVFVGGRIYDSRRDVIGVVLTDADKANIAAMAPGATVYAEFTAKGEPGGPGIRRFDPACVDKLLARVKERAS